MTSVSLFVREVWLTKFGIAIAASTAINATTIMTSMSVNPRSDRTWPIHSYYSTASGARELAIAKEPRRTQVLSEMRSFDDSALLKLRLISAGDLAARASRRLVAPRDARNTL
ncbi:MAG TPA: hypothetical protein PKU97_11180, partial [Kofleriaceae bacterium]|nr:hypothetical protein [Kofleriaceae bacterium]